VIILLGFVVCGLLGLALVIAGMSGKNLAMGPLGCVLVILVVAAAVVIKASCDPGCELGVGMASTLLRSG
jgi:hypothetical protein